MSRWNKKKLPEVADILMGQSPPGETYNTESRGIPFFQGKAEFGDTHPTTKKWCSSPLRIAEQGDILLSVRAPVGPTNVAKERCCIGRGLAAIRAKTELVSATFLRFFFKAHERTIAGRGVGSTFDAIGREEIARIEIPIPPLSEQERIVSVLNEANELGRMRVEAECRTADLTPALFHEMFGDPSTNPRRWPTGILGNVIYAAKDGPHVSPEYTKRGVPFLSTRNIRPGKIVWEDMKFISEGEAQQHWKKCKPEFGDILYTKGGTTGLAKAVDFSTEVAVWVHIAVLKTNHDRVDPAWLENMLNSRFCYDQSQQLTHGIANRDLGLTQMMGMRIYIPPLPLQREFGTRAEDIRRLEAEQATSRQRLDDLFQSLLHRAFQGEL